MKTIIKCCGCKKKKAKEESYASEINNILTNKKNLIQVDSMKLNSQKDTPLNNNTKIENKSDSNANEQNKQFSKSFAFPAVKMRIKSQVSLNSKTNAKSKKEKRFLHEFKDKLRCVFCGGKDCKHENYIHNLDNENAIDGLNSNFITDWVIASQRPSEVLIKDYELVTKFKEYEIALIVNLQREGEHPYCGPNAYNLTSAGYSYNPSMFTGDNIKCKLSGWKDMSVPSSMNFMLEIVKDMTQTVNDLKKRVLVHCHAGYGRTGVVIACYLLFNSDKKSDTVISEIRRRRKKCIESSDQKSFCQKFHDFLIQTRMLFDKKEAIDVYLKRQEDLLYGNEINKYGFIPKIITKTFEKIINLKDKYSLENQQIFSLMKGIKIEWNDEYEDILDMLKLLLNKNNWDLYDQIENLILIVELLFDWFEDYVHSVISPEKTELIVYNELFVSYQDFIASNKDLTIKQERLEELFLLIKKIYHCFEYEILFQFASFCSLITPMNARDKTMYNEMIERMAYGLLGFSMNDEKNKSIEALVEGLIGIIKLICTSLLSDESEERLKMIHPLRKTIQLLSPKKQTNKISSTNQIIEDSSKAKAISSPPSTILMNHLNNLKNLPGLSPKEMKMLNAFEYLSNHFSDNIELLDKINNNNPQPIEPLNEIMKKASEDQTVSNFFQNNLDRVIEETIHNNNSLFNSSLGASSNVEDDNDNKSKNHKTNSNQTITDLYTNLKKKPIATPNESPKKNSVCNQLINNNKKSSLITFESFRRSLLLNNDSKQFSSLASIMKKDFEHKVEGKCVKNVHIAPLPQIADNPELMKELVLFKERQSQRQTTSKMRNARSKCQSKASSARNSKFKEEKSNISEVSNR